MPSDWCSDLFLFQTELCKRQKAMNGCLFNNQCVSVCGCERVAESVHIMSVCGIKGRRNILLKKKLIYVYKCTKASAYS